MGGRVSIEKLRSGAFRVTTTPKIGRFHKRFYKPLHRKPFDQALGFAARAAAELGFDLKDESGTVPADMCAALVEELRAD